MQHSEQARDFSQENITQKRGIEFNLKNIDAQEPSLTKQLEDALNKDAADQLIFVLRTFQKDDFVNHCNIATQTLGERLNTSFGGEGSFFDEAPTYTLFDTRAYGSLEKAGWRGEFHSVGLLTGKNDKKEPYFIIIDLTYSTVHQKYTHQEGALVFAAKGTSSEALRYLHDTYGGVWNTQFIFKNGQKQFLGH